MILVKPGSIPHVFFCFITFSSPRNPWRFKQQELFVRDIIDSSICHGMPSCRRITVEAWRAGGNVTRKEVGHGGTWDIFRVMRKGPNLVIFILPIGSMYGIFTYIYQILPLKTTKCREILPYMDGKGWEKSSFQGWKLFFYRPGWWTLGSWKCFSGIQWFWKQIHPFLDSHIKV